MKLRNKGETGIGTLIVFIAMILVAAIAASVLLGTAGSLQQKALATGKQSQQEVSSGMQVVTISATNGSLGSLQAYEMMIKLTAGSDALSLNDTFISFDTKSTTQNLKYGGIYPTVPNVTTTNFTAEYLKNGTDHLDDYLVIGDVVKLRFNSTNPITQASAMKIRLLPKHGVIVPIDIITPDVISTERVILYP